MTLASRVRAFALALSFAAAAFAPGALAQKGEAVRPEVGKPLQAAQALIKAHKGKDALAEIAKAEAVPNRTPGENLLIQQMRGSASVLAGDHDGAIRAFEAVLASGKVSGREESEMVKAVAVAYYSKKDYANAAKWSQRYFKDGGADGQMRTVLLQSYYLGNDCAAVSKILGSAVAEEGATNGRKPAEEELQILANCYLKQKDTAGYVAAIEKLVVYYPKKDYWNDLLSRVQKKPGFSDRLGVHVYRLRFATGNAGSTADYMEMAQLALQQGTPGEAKMFIDKGYAAGVLGKGEEASRQERLKVLVQKSLDESLRKRAEDEKEAQAAKDGNLAVAIGLNYVYEGKPEKGLPMIEQGLRKGGLKRPDDAKLRYGEALLHAGHKQKAVTVLKDVKGADGTADLARLWVLSARA